MKESRIFLLLILFGLLPACATITKGTTDEVLVRSDPNGAEVTTDLGYHGITPANIEHKRKKTYTITVEKNGYKPTQIFIDNKFSGSGAAGLAGNILIGGIIGLGVDAATGSTLNHYPDNVFVKLVPVDAEGESNVTIMEDKLKTEETGPAFDAGEVE